MSFYLRICGLILLAFSFVLHGAVPVRSVSGTVQEVQRKLSGPIRPIANLNVKLYDASNNLERACTTRLYDSPHRWLGIVTTEEAWYTRRFRRFSHGELMFGPKFHVPELLEAWTVVTNAFLVPFERKQISSSTDYVNSFSFTEISKGVCFEQDSGRWMFAQTLPVLYRFYSDVSNRNSMAYISALGRDEWRVSALGERREESDDTYTRVHRVTPAELASWNFPVPKEFLSDKNVDRIFSREGASCEKERVRVECEHLRIGDGTAWRRTRYRGYFDQKGRMYCTVQDDGGCERVYKYTVENVARDNFEHRRFPILRTWQWGYERYSVLVELREGKFLLADFVKDPFCTPSECPARVSLVCSDGNELLSSFSRRMTDLVLLDNLPWLNDSYSGELFRIP